jgi:hypothetical protein
MQIELQFYCLINDSYPITVREIRGCVWERSPTENILVQTEERYINKVIDKNYILRLRSSSCHYVCLSPSVSTFECLNQCL